MSLTISGLGSSLNDVLQRIAKNPSAAQTTDAATAAASSSAQPVDNGSAASSANGVRHHHHLRRELFKKIESSVTDALQSISSDPSADPNKVVQDAIAKVLKDSGINLPATGQTQDAAAAATANGTTAKGKGSDPDQDGDVHGAGGGPRPQDTAFQAFVQLLQSHGIDAKQFRQDFQTALDQARGGQVDPSTALKSFPPGTVIDTTT